MHIKKNLINKFLSVQRNQILLETHFISIRWHVIEEWFFELQIGWSSGWFHWNVNLFSIGVACLVTSRHIALLLCVLEEGVSYTFVGEVSCVFAWGTFLLRLCVEDWYKSQWGLIYKCQQVCQSVSCCLEVDTRLRK